VNTLIFEGVSGSGKTTLMARVLAATQYNYLAVHRFTASQWVYAGLNGRKVDVEFLRNIERALLWVCKPRTIWCRPSDPGVAELRTAQKGDLIVNERDFVRADRLFMEYYDKHSLLPQPLVLDTADWSIDECMRRIDVWLTTTQ
jgi:thymidylate kinase